MRVEKQILITSFVLIGIFFLFELSNIDIFVQEFFYNSTTHKWLLEHVKGSILDIVFYSGIKKAIIVFGVLILFIYIYSFKSASPLLKSYRGGLLIVWLSIAIVPMIIGTLKANTNVPCPCDFMHFGGEYPYIRALDSMPQEIVKKFKCYPAGHASGGFALMSLFFLFKEKKNSFIAFGVAMIIGWSMGIYKMLIGHHYLSHTLITMILAWLLILVIYKITKRYSLS
ncbi:MAG: phosphoesterase [Sulfurimonas sp. RIFOXYD12_FULL_33_39]|uniref:phosphatase PAP2 family protein n=1 Tax=unclassified Sulfurimonas TaxID=2623549 RepID=UPI0008C8F8E8|nr:MULTISPECIES: phosphatase PAP2 family protein [unclassified Sulfurimonas]OHE07050.1 MAG: phosphoesterase [Sulfurimonas sp. RIFCSPLOWO2_12_FULL_34_6]OHE10618.1 MAG: phosphoesterase [Sulfurimonas sp. RIFOXYD12_FULL_33_39]OHE15076.1 MAG: phosphoesterase [Sulfurimonas sp. RIFOXYD2_FULL_34_21]